MTAAKVAPFRPGARHIPSYYRPRRPLPPDADPLDIADAFDLDPASAWALKYLLRAGRKPNEPAAKDLTKALECIQRRLEQVRGSGRPARSRRPTRPRVGR